MKDDLLSCNAPSFMLSVDRAASVAQNLRC